MVRAAGLLVALLVFGSMPDPAEAEWTRLRSANFLFVGDASERDIREIARKLEQFREALVRALPKSTTASDVPTIVLVFGSDRSFTPFKPRFQGKPVDLAGLFQGGRDVNYIVMAVEWRDQALRTIFHEYTHLITANTVSSPPVWLGEGLAEFYETFEERDGGKSAMIGVPAVQHLQTLQTTELLPIDELMAVEHSSPIYNEGNRRGIFYAQSWALTHYLILGNAKRTPQLHAYLARLEAGEQPRDAFRSAFQTDPKTLETELNGYIRRFGFPAVRFNFNASLRDTATGRGESIEEWEARVYLGDFLARSGPDREEDARAYLVELLKIHPDAPLALSALGLLESRSDNHDKALPLLRKAADLAPADGAIQAAFGRALLYEAHADRTDRSAFDVHLEHAHTALSRAIALEPASESHRLTFAEVLMAQEDFDRARSELGPLLASGSRDEIREEARKMLAWLASATDSAAPNPADAADAAPAAAVPSEPLPNTTGANPSAAPLTASVLRSTPAPVLRTVMTGEVRLLARFESVECREGLIVLHINAEGRALRLAATAFDQIDFITYRSDAPDGVNCGRISQPPLVLATYRPNARNADAPTGEADGEAVAIELLPDDYVPR